MRPDSITLGIEEKYSAEEFADIAKKMAAAIAEVETISTEKKVSDAAFNERIKKADAEVSTLARRYNKGCEVAQIGCDIRYDVPEVGKKSYVRMDTGEAVEVHDMSWKEKQETIQFPLAAAPEPSAEQITETLADVQASATDQPTFRCPKCKAAQINCVDNAWVCLKCGFRTQDEDELLFDIPSGEPPTDPTSADPEEAA